MQLLVMGLILMVPSGLAYTGVWRRWARRTHLHWPFGVGWAGLGLAWTDIGALIAEKVDEGTGLAVMDVGAVLGLFGIVAAFMLPHFLLPTWYRRMKGLGRRYRPVPPPPSASGEPQ